MVTFFPAPKTQKFCTQCGSTLSRIVPPLDTHIRDVCLNCGAVHYKNPLIVVGSLVVHNDKILMCKRGIEPRYGKWTLPAGFMELDESTEQGAVRETHEEAGAEIDVHGLLTIVDVPHVSQVHIIYLATLKNINFTPRDETLEVKFFAYNEIPWEQVAFRTIETSIKYYLDANTQKALVNGLIPVLHTTLYDTNNLIK